MTEVGSAYVRLRPNLTGFKAETETGVASAFSGIGKIIGGAFAAAGAFHFGKEAIVGAADLQKQIEAINAEFGNASKSVLAFGEHGAQALGLTEHAADSASAKFGLLFKNLGLAPAAAAEMSIGLEKTAGALGRIKNVDPGTVLQGLTAGLRGQGRGLAQFGIVLDQNTIKLEALKLHLISTTKDAITPAQKAIAAYTLITAGLPGYLDEAKKHAGDFANVLTDFKVAASDATERLGTKLLPVATAVFKVFGDAIPGLSRLSGEVFTTLQQAVEKLLAPFGGAKQAFDDLRDAARDVVTWLNKVLQPIGGLKGAMVGLLAIFAVDKILTFASAIRDKVAGAFGILQGQAQQGQRSITDANAAIKSSAEGIQTSLGGVAESATASLSSIDAGITGVSDALDALNATAKTTLTNLRAVAIAPVRAPTPVAPSPVAQRLATTIESTAPVAAIAAGFGAEEVTKVGSDFASVAAKIADESKKVGDAVKEGFDASSVEDYTGHIKEVADKLGEVRSKAAEAGHSLSADLTGGAKTATGSLVTSAAAGTNATTQIATSAQAAGEKLTEFGREGKAAGVQTSEAFSTLAKSVQTDLAAVRAEVGKVRTDLSGFGPAAGGAAAAVGGSLDEMDADLASFSTAIDKAIADFSGIKAEAAGVGSGVAKDMEQATAALTEVNTDAADADAAFKTLGSTAGGAAEAVGVAGKKMAVDLAAVDEQIAALNAKFVGLRAEMTKPIIVPPVPAVAKSQFGATPSLTKPFSDDPAERAAFASYRARLAGTAPTPAEVAAGKKYRAELEKLVSANETTQDPLRHAALRRQAAVLGESSFKPTSFLLPQFDAVKAQAASVGASLQSLGAAGTSSASRLTAPFRALRSYISDVAHDVGLVGPAASESFGEISAAARAATGGIGALGTEGEAVAARFSHAFDTAFDDFNLRADRNLYRLGQGLVDVGAEGEAAGKEIEAGIAKADGAFASLGKVVGEQVGVISDRLKTAVGEWVHGFEAVGVAGTASFAAVAGAAAGAGDVMAGVGTEAEALGPQIEAATSQGIVGFLRLDAAAAGFKASAVEAGAAARASLVSFGQGLRSVFTTIAEFSKQVLLFGLIIGLTEAYNRSKKFHDAVNELFATIKAKLIPVIDDLYAKLKQPVSDAIQKIGEYARAAVPHIENLIQTIKHLPLEVKAVGLAVAGILAALAGIAGGPVVAIAALATAFGIAYKHSETFRGVIHALGEDLKQIGQWVNDAVAAFKRLPGPVKEAVVAIGGIAVALGAIFIATGGIGLIVVGIGALIVAFTEAYRRSKDFRIAVDDLAQVFVGVGHAIKDWAVGVFAVVKDLFQVLRGVFEVFEGIVTLNWHKTWQGLKDIVSGLLHAVIDEVKTWIRVIEDLFIGLWKGVETIFLKGVEKIAGLLAKIPTKITIFGHTFGSENPFKKWDSDLKHTIGNLEAASPEAKRAAKKIGDSFVSGFTGSLSGIQKTIDGLLNKTPSDQGGNVRSDAHDRLTGADTAKAINDAAQTIYDQLKKANDAGDAEVKKLRSNLAQLHDNLIAALKQQTDDVNNAVAQAKQNLQSLASTIAGDIGTVLDKPLQDAQNKLTAFQNRQNLAALSRSAVLPGGVKLSADPKAALAQLEALQRNASNVTKGAIAQFISQYRSAVLATQQDKVNQVKSAAQQRLADLAYAFSHGKISSKQFTAGLVAELKRDHVSFKQAGKELGTAFAGGFQDAFQGATDQAAALGRAQKAGISLSRGGPDVAIIDPLKVLHHDQQNIEKIHRQIGNKQIQLQSTIEKNTRRAADLLAQLKALPDSATVKVPGRGSVKARDAVR